MVCCRRLKTAQLQTIGLVGRLAPELLQLAEEQAKALNAAYENAVRTRRHAIPDAAAA